MSEPIDVPIIESSLTYQFDENGIPCLCVKFINSDKWVRCKFLSEDTFKGVWKPILSSVFVTENGFVYYQTTNEPVQHLYNHKHYVYCLIVENREFVHFPVHRLVANAFIVDLDPTKDQINHKDGNKENNHYSNLEWVTCQENIAHAYSTGLITRKFSEKEILEIRSLYPRMTQQALADKYEVTISIINQIINGHIYKDIEYNTDFVKNKTKSGEDNPNAKLSIEDVIRIRSMYPKTSMDELGKMYNVDATCIGNIIKNKTYYDPTYKIPSTERIGETHHRSKLTMDQVKEIRNLAKTHTHEKLAEKYGLSRTSVTRIVLNQAYPDTSYTPPEKKDQSGTNSGKSKVTLDQVKEIREKYVYSSTYQLAKEYGIGSSTVMAIVQNKTYHDPDYIPIKKK